MIERVTVQNNIKSWNVSQSNVSVTFGQKNIVYGLNGSGKSSFAKILAKNLDINSARLFGRDYIRKNMVLKDDTSIKGVKSDFSNKNVEVEARLEQKRKEIEEAESEITKAKDEIKTIEKDSFSMISEIVKRRKAGNAKINNKPAGKTLKETVALWNTDYENAKNKFPNEDFNQITGKADFSQELRSATEVQISDGANLELLDFQEINNILSTNYDNINIPSNEVVSWIECGTKLHENANTCLFCGAENFSIRKIKNKLETYRNNEKNKAEELLEDSISGLDNLLGSLTVLSDSISEEKMEEISSFLNDSKNTIRTKIGNMSKNDNNIDINLLEKYQEIIQSAGASHNKMRENNIKNIEDKINRVSDLVKGAIGKEVTESKVLNKNIDDITALEGKIQASEDASKKLKKECDDLVAEKNDINDFKEYLNRILLDLGLDFELTLSDENSKSYSLVHRENAGQKLTIADISEGEERLLALLYFYYEMHDKPDERKMLDSVETIIIDDPICSLDDNNRFYIRELLKDLLEHDDIQVFILTHSWDDFCSLCYGHERQYSLFEIQKKDAVSSIKEISNTSVLKPYRLLFNEVYRFSKKKQADITDDEALHMPNTLRRVLEEYLSFRINIDRATQNKADDIFKLLTGENSVSDIKPQKKIKLNKLLSICNILSHNTNSQPKNKNEVLDAAQCFVGCLEMTDMLHIQKMILPET